MVKILKTRFVRRPLAWSAKREKLRVRVFSIFFFAYFLFIDEKESKNKVFGFFFQERIESLLKEI